MYATEGTQVLFLMCAYDGPETGSTGDVVFDRTMRQAIVVNEAKQINANEDVFSLAA